MKRDGTTGRGGNLAASRRLVCGHLIAGLCIWAAAPAVPAKPPADKPSPLDNWQATTKELLERLAENHLLPPSTPETRSQFIQAILKTLTRDGMLEPARKPNAASRNPGPNDTPQATTLGNQLRYLRLRQLGEGSAERIRRNNEQHESGAPRGLILDLRGASGDAAEEVTRCVEAVRALALPVAVLVDGETSRMAERLAAELRTTCAAVVIGSATRGTPFPARRISLSGGEIISIPDVPAAETRQTHWVPQPLEPDVLVETEDKSSPPDGADRRPPPLDMRNDLCVRRAVDLLTAIHAFDGE